MALLTSGSSAYGDTAPSQVEVAVARGVAFRRAQRDVEALQAFEQAYEIEPSARIRAQIALAQQALGRWLAAEASLATALGVGGDPWIEKNRSVLDAAMIAIRAHLATIDVSSNVEGATLYVNGIAEGPLPRRARVEAGTVALDGSSAGYMTVRRTLDVAPGAIAREVLTLVPMLNHDGETTPPAPPQPEPALALTPLPAESQPAPRARSAEATWALASFVGAGVMTASGIAAVVARQSHLTTYNEDTSRCPPATRSTTCDDERTAVTRATAFAAVAFGVGAVLAGTGVVLVVHGSTASAKKTAWVGLRGSQLTLGGAF